MRVYDFQRLGTLYIGLYARFTFILCALKKFLINDNVLYITVEFVIRNKFSTDTYTKCIYFTDSSLLVGTTKVS